MLTDLSLSFTPKLWLIITADAGTDQSIILPRDNTLLNGSASHDPDGTIKEWRWTKISGPASYYFSRATMAETAVTNLDSGNYEFVLKITDSVDRLQKIQ